jgi:predicted PurR-regulated permease PerM
LSVNNPNVKLQRAFYSLALLLMVVAALYWGRSVLLPLALAALFAFILTPAVSWLERHHFRRLPAVLVVTLLVFALVGGLGYFLTVEMGQLAEQLPQHTETIKDKIVSLREGSSGTLSKLLGMVKELTDSLQDVNRAAQTSGVGSEPADSAWSMKPDLHWLTGFAGSAAELLATAALVIVLAIFMLAQREDLRDRLIRLFGRGHLSTTTRAFDEAAERISRYLLMLVLVNTAYGTVLSLGLYLLGVPFALLWGFLAASLRFIPYIGIWIGAAFPILLSVATAPGWLGPLLVIGLILALELFVANVIEPILYGRSMGVSEVALLVSAAFWAWLWGPVGLILSVPLTVCLAVLGKYISQLDFLWVLLGAEPVLDIPVRYYQRLLAHDEDEAGDMVEVYLRDHPWESVFDEVLLPALALARRDLERGELEADERQEIIQATHQVLDDLVFRQQQISKIAKVPVGEQTPQRPMVTALGLPAHDEGDELCLRMLALLLEPAGCRLEVQSSQALTAEMLHRADEERPAFLVIASLPPGGLSPTRHLCKRLRAQFSELKILVVRWGQEEDLDPLRTGLRQAGADSVVTTLQEARAQLVPLVQLAAHRSAPAPEPVAS